MRTDFKSAFFDTAPFIYLIEGHIQFAPLVRDILIYCQSHSVQLTTSVLTGLEFKTKPLRNNRLDVVNAFDGLIADMRMNVVSITADTQFESDGCHAAWRGSRLSVRRFHYK